MAIESMFTEGNSWIYYVGHFFVTHYQNKLRKLENFGVTLILFRLAYLSTPKWAGTPCMSKKSAKIDLDHYSGLSNSPKKISSQFFKKRRFFLIALILTPILGQNTKMAITQKQLNRFIKYSSHISYSHQCTTLTEIWSKNSNPPRPRLVDSLIERLLSTL